MIDIGEYFLSDEAGVLRVDWIGSTLPVELKVIALGLLILMPILFIFRRPLAAFADRHMHIHLSPTVYGVIAPIVSLGCGTFLIFVREPSQIMSMTLDQKGVSVTAGDKTSTTAWNDIATAVVLDPKQARDGGGLVLTTKSGGQNRLPIFRMAFEHQDKVVQRINTETNNRFALSVNEGEDSEE